MFAPYEAAEGSTRRFAGSVPKELKDPLPRDPHDAGNGIERHSRLAGSPDRRTEGLPGVVDVGLGLTGSSDGTA
jgi:hypothetical protein